MFIVALYKFQVLHLELHALLQLMQKNKGFVSSPVSRVDGVAAV